MCGTGTVGSGAAQVPPIAKDSSVAGAAGGGDVAGAAGSGDVMAMLQQIANSADLASVKADITTIATWVSIRATAGSVASPPPEVTTAFDNIKTFADTHC